MTRLTRTSLARQFLAASFVILLVGMLVIGWWVSRQIERGVINQTAGVTALYVDSFVAPHLQTLARGNTLSSEDVSTLDALLSTTPLGRRIVAFKVWSLDGEILFSTSPNLIGRRFDVGPGLKRASTGLVAAHISDLQSPENVEERKRWASLVETYAPVRLGGTEQVIAVSEFYQSPDELLQEISAAQRASWIIVGVCTIAMYILLAGMVGRGSNIIRQQRRELEDTVAELRTLLSENAKLHERVRSAAARAVAINERFLRRIGSDLHDGPGQDIGLALLRLDALEERCAQCGVPQLKEQLHEDLEAIQVALQFGLRDLRAISAGLRLPELNALTPNQIAARAVDEHERKTKAHVELRADAVTQAVPLPVKMTLYRLVQESLANGHRHAPGAEQVVRLWTEDGMLCLEISDNGVGFDPQTINADDGRLGLAGMRERVRALGGSFAVLSSVGKGTQVRARLPEDVSDE